MAQPFAQQILPQPRPDNLGFALPRRTQYFPSPADWRDQILYFLLPDRFSDAAEHTRPLLNRSNLPAARRIVSGAPWRWDKWHESGSQRFQGGTIRGITSKLGYLQQLGITAIWVGPIFQQRGHLDTYHGYGIQDFLDVDPRFGNRQDLVDLVDQAHAVNIRIILDIIFNHSGKNWIYPQGTPGGVDRPAYTTGRYNFGSWLGDQGQAVASIQNRPEGVWPAELQQADVYTRAGNGSLAGNDIDNPNAEEKRTDFGDLRDFNVADGGVLNNLARCFKYWIALTDCDGFRIDTLKHVSLEEARNFCGSIKEFANTIGKADFFIAGEIAGGDFNQDRYLDVLQQNLNAALDIGDMRLTLTRVAKGFGHPDNYFSGFDPGSAGMGSHRNVGRHHVSVLDDHDHVFGEKARFSTFAPSDHQVVAGTALQLLTLGIPCIYYGSEQAFAGPEASERQWLPCFLSCNPPSDAYLREAMFGPAAARKPGLAGLGGATDPDLPGFGPFGTAGHHCFDPNLPAFRRIAALTRVRSAFPGLRVGRQYLRQTSFLGRPFQVYGDGELMAWSRILDDEEVLCVLNPHGTARRGADVVVDAQLNSAQNAQFEVIANTEQAGLANPAAYGGTHATGSRLNPQRRADGLTFLPIRDIGPSEVVVLTNRP